MIAPQSPPAIAYLSYPNFCINSARITAIRSGEYPGSDGISEKPKPGRDGATM